MHGSGLRHWPVLFLSSGLVFMASGMACPAHADSDTPHALLARMSSAIAEQAYEGTFVHLQGSDSSVMHVVRELQDGQMTERVSCEDSGGEITRSDGELISVIAGGQGAVLVERLPQETGQVRSPLHWHLRGSAGVDGAQYVLGFGVSERVAGRDTSEIVIRPRDGFRYGYRLWLDKSTYVPLKTQLVDLRGRVLEQILFTHVHFADGSVPGANQQLPARSRLVDAAPAGTARALPVDHETGEWAAARVPPGFQLTIRSAEVPPALAGRLHQAVYSDGLATVSLFVEPAIEAAGQFEGLSEIGAANAYTISRDGFMITAVGEVPAVTVKMFATSAHPLDGRGRLH